MFKKSQNQTSKARYRYLHIKSALIWIFYIIFLTTWSLFYGKHTDNYNLQAS